MSTGDGRAGAGGDGHNGTAGAGGDGRSKARGHELGVIGLGRMGGSLALQAAERGFRVVGYSRSAAPGLEEAGVTIESSLEEFVTDLAPPRLILVYIPAGPDVDGLLEELTPLLETGDVVADGGNSYWGDSLRRHRELEARGIELVDLGTSGGVEGARRGACFMAGGSADALAWIEPTLEALAVAGGYARAGPPGAGHFVKLVHNGIEFAMLQAIAEGVDLLEHYGDPLPVADVLSCWRHGSVIRSWLIDLMEEAYRDRGGLGDVPAHVEDTGEVSWLVSDALEMERPAPAISQAVIQLLSSRDRTRTWARAIAMMRRGFGGHPLGEDAGVRRERREGRVGDIRRGT